MIIIEAISVFLSLISFTLMLKVLQLLSWLKINQRLGDLSKEVVLKKKKRAKITIVSFLSSLVLSSIGVWMYSVPKVAMGITFCNSTMFVIVLAIVLKMKY